MKVDFNSWDFNLNKIETDSRLGDFKPNRLDFKIYGLSNDKDTPPVLISYDFTKITLDKNKRAMLYRLLKKNGVWLAWDNTNESLTQYQRDDKVHIGLQYDLRKDIDLCTAILHTIVYYLEEKIDLKGNLPGIPRIILDN